MTTKLTARLTSMNPPRPTTRLARNVVRLTTAGTVVAVLSARYWPKLGERVALLLAGKPAESPDKNADPDRGSA